MKKVIKLLMAGLSLISLNVSAAMVNGSLLVGGAYSATGGVNLADATSISLGSVYANGGTGDVDGTVDVFTPGGTGNMTLSLTNFESVANFFTVGDWQFDITSLMIADQTVGVLNLMGTGLLSGNGYDVTDATWSFSSSSTTSYSMTVATSVMSPVPVPASVWLLGSGLLGLVSIARRKA